MKSDDSPCLNCPERELGCQSTCKNYIAYKKSRRELNEKRRQVNSINDYFRGAINHSMRLRGNRV